jgi:hypothetical protein
MVDGRGLALELLPATYAVARLDPSEVVPTWAVGAFVSITRTEDELSIVCPLATVPPAVRAERGFRCLRVAGPLAFDQVGVLSSLATPLARAGVSIFVVSTYDSDYLLVKSAIFELAVEALSAAGHSVQRVDG